MGYSVGWEFSDWERPKQKTATPSAQHAALPAALGLLRARTRSLRAPRCVLERAEGVAVFCLGLYLVLGFQYTGG